MWQPIDKSYTWINKLPTDQRERATKPPRSKPECDVLLMVGMIGCGKSHWVKNKVETEPAKRWNVIGTPQLLKKMKVGEPDISVKRLALLQSLFILVDLATFSMFVVC